MKKELSLSEVVEYFKKNKPSTNTEGLDELYNYLIAASSIATLVLAPDPTTAISAFCTTAGMASIKISNLLSWLPDKFKFGKKDREDMALERYELAGITNFMLFNIAIRHSFEEIIIPVFANIIPSLVLTTEEKENLNKLSADVDQTIQNTPVSIHSQVVKEELFEYATIITNPIFQLILKKQEEQGKSQHKLNKTEVSKIQTKYQETALLYYNAYLINISTEFPEFALWADVSLKQRILKELNSSVTALKDSDRQLELKFISAVDTIIKKIETLRNQTFSRGTGFPTFKKSYEQLFQRQSDHLFDRLNAKIKDNIQAHQNQIKAELNRPLIDNEDIDDIIYPKTKDIYISQSFQQFTYRKKLHGRSFLTPEFWNKYAKKGENIGNELLETLANPNFCHRPIILLGNPGAGKSMLSKMFAGALAETNDFIPFLIKLRNVATGTTNISEHIAKGLSKSIENLQDINWIDCAKEFKDRIPVIILDGFDELMRFSQSELNNYLNSIKEFQETGLNHGICSRVILTSRIAVMQDVSIPENTKVIKLNGFDTERKKLWVEIWNQHQKKENYKFELPENENIQQLAQEPLLLFMLGVYDFESEGLQNMAKTKDFSQSKLYDSLLDNFAIRQLEKNEGYSNATVEQKKVEKELFRLRLGMIALLMFLNNTTNKDIHNLTNELEAFELDKSTIQKENILGGFFFIHENKSITEGEIERLNYEFLHKTFGEFLAADFLLRVAVKQTDIRSKEKLATDATFKFCFGYNWLHKHNNILSFLIKHAPTLIKYPSENATYVIENIIKKDLKNIFNKGFQGFSVPEFVILKPHDVVEHLAIYSQNLIFLWLAITGERPKIDFEIYDHNDSIGNESAESIKYEAQDRNETNKNKLLWKRLCNLWGLVGNKYAIAKLHEWMKVEERPDRLVFKKEAAEVSHNYFDAASIAVNDFESILSFFDVENHFFDRKANIIDIIDNLIAKKPELAALAIDAVLYRFADQHYYQNRDIVHWVSSKNLSMPQTMDFVRLIIYHRELVPIQVRYDIFRKHKNSGTFNIILDEILKDLDQNSAILRDPELLDLLNDVLSVDARQIIFHSESEADTLLKYVLVVKKLNLNWVTEGRLHSGIYEDLFQALSKGISHHHRKKPEDILVYLRALNEMQNLYPFNHHGNPHFFEEALQDLFGEVNYLIKEDPKTVLEYLKIIFSLNKSFKIRNSLHKKIADALKLLAKDDDFFFNNDFQISLLFLELVNGIANYSLNIKINHRLLDEMIYRTVKDIEISGRFQAWKFLDYLSLLKEIRKYAPNIKISMTALLEDNINKLFRDVRHLSRNEPTVALEFLKFVNELNGLYSSTSVILNNIIRDINENILLEAKYIIEDSPLLAIDYLSLVLSGAQLIPMEISPSLYAIIKALGRIKLPNKEVRKITLLLIKQRVDHSLLMPYLERFPELNSIYQQSPEIAYQVSLIYQELES